MGFGSNGCVRVTLPPPPHDPRDVGKVTAGDDVGWWHWDTLSTLSTGERMNLSTKARLKGSVH